MRWAFSIYQCYFDKKIETQTNNNTNTTASLKIGERKKKRLSFWRPADRKRHLQFGFVMTCLTNFVLNSFCIDYIFVI